jgi:hypothetical protein
METVINFIKRGASLVVAYFLSLLSALIGKNIKKWHVFYIGELGVTQLTFNPGMFHPQDRLFLKAEKVPSLQKGNINDVYNQMKVDKENQIAIYCKQMVDSSV